MKLKTFPKGGIHPPEKKNPDYDKDNLNATLPSMAVIPLSQHIGSPSECLVKPGDLVEEEQLIGKASGFVSSGIHASIPGEVKEIKEIFLPNGKKSEAVVIELKGEFKRSGKPEQVNTWRDYTNEQLIDIIRDKGVVGLGGATFPTHVKLSVPEEIKLKHLIVNAAECEPYLCSDHVLMLEKSDEIAEGLKILKRILSPDNVIVGIEDNKRDAAAALQKSFSQLDLNAEVALLKTKYPQGAEKNLVQAIIGKEIPSGKLPLALGVVNVNVSTVFAVYEAVCLDKPLVDRFVTIAGGAVKNPGVYRVKVGTSARDLFEECGGFTEEPEKIIFGGPMMGFSVFDPDIPVTKGTSGILALTKKDIKKARVSTCLQCGRCVQSCPMGLNPSYIYKLIDHSEYEEAQEQGLLDCVECGSCAFECPAHLYLVQQYRAGKTIVRRSKGAKN